MNTLIVIGILIISAIQGFSLYRLRAFAKANALITRIRLKRIQPLFDRLETAEPVTERDVYDYAKNILTREMTFKLLEYHNLEDIFPNEFNTFEKAAESNLANWLEFPTELNTCPDEIEYIKRVTIGFNKQNLLYYYEVFKFRVNAPHWAAKRGWMFGVVGPYFTNSKPYDHPGSTFSRLNRIPNAVSPDQEAKWVHENIFPR